MDPVISTRKFIPWSIAVDQKKSDWLRWLQEFSVRGRGESVRNLGIHPTKKGWEFLGFAMNGFSGRPLYVWIQRFLSSLIYIYIYPKQEGSWLCIYIYINSYENINNCIASRLYYILLIKLIHTSDIPIPLWNLPKKHDPNPLRYVPVAARCGQRNILVEVAVVETAGGYVVRCSSKVIGNHWKSLEKV